MSALVIDFVEIDEIIPYENNAKEHPDEQVLQIARSIEEFGFNDPIAVDGNGTIIEGHGRLLAAKKLGLDRIPIIRLGHLSEDQRRAYIIAHNKLTMNSGFDLDVLAEEMKALDSAGFDLELTGFDLDEIDKLELLFGNEDAAEEEESAGDYIPDVEERSAIKRGDIIELGKHRVICGDSTSHDDVVALMKGSIADLLLTDPPYNVDYEGKTADAMKIDNDSMDDESFRKFLVDVFSIANASLKDGGGVLYLACGFRRAEFSGGVQRCRLEGAPMLSLVKKRNGNGETGLSLEA